MRAASLLSILAGGMLFGYGLAWSTMVSPEVVLSFLRFQDFGLMMVMGGAVAVALPAYQLLPRLMARPLLEPQFEIRVSAMDKPTLLGAAVFGIGWGISGVCPGPAIVAIGTGNWPVLVALAGMIAGAWVQGWLINGARR